MLDYTFICELPLMMANGWDDRACEPQSEKPKKDDSRTPADVLLDDGLGISALFAANEQSILSLATYVCAHGVKVTPFWIGMLE